MNTAGSGVGAPVSGSRACRWMIAAPASAASIDAARDLLRRDRQIVRHAGRVDRAGDGATDDDLAGHRVSPVAAAGRVCLRVVRTARGRRDRSRRVAGACRQIRSAAPVRFCRRRTGLPPPSRLATTLPACHHRAGLIDWPAIKQPGELMQAARLAVDIGGTFTDLALEHAGRRTTIKVLTTPAAPEQGVMDGVRAHPARRPASRAGDIGIVIHGTTLATNAIIERKGARTALITTEGFRDVLAMGNESRYDQYDLNIALPEPLVPRHLRLAGAGAAGQRGPGAAAARRSGGARAGAGAASARRSRASRSASCTPSSIRRHEQRVARDPGRGAAGRSGVAVVARSRRRCANGSASPPPSPTPMCSR